MKHLLTALLLLTATTAFAANYEEVMTPIEGQVLSWKRTPSAKILNPYGQAPSLEAVTERMTLYPNGDSKADFVRRVSVSYSDFAGKRFPIYDANMNQVGYASGDTLWSVMLGAWVLGEKKADNQVGTLLSDPATICYTTNASDPICKLP